MSNDQGVVLVEQFGIPWQALVEHCLEVAVARVRLAPSEPMEDAARECVDHEDGSVECVKENVVGCLFADAIHGEELGSKIMSGALGHEFDGVPVLVTEEFAEGPEPSGP